jgi:hypothetical protein
MFPSVFWRESALFQCVVTQCGMRIQALQINCKTKFETFLCSSTNLIYILKFISMLTGERVQADGHWSLSNVVTKKQQIDYFDLNREDSDN